jgi:hypothetical protein
VKPSRIAGHRGEWKWPVATTTESYSSVPVSEVSRQADPAGSTPSTRLLNRTRSLTPKKSAYCCR